MRATAIIGILLIVLGIVAFSVQGVTYFTQDRVVDAGPVKIDVQHPHTIIFNPVVGVVALVAGGILLVLGRRERV